MSPHDPPPAAATNRLIAEPSPYLRLHAHNPVDWYPWGEEAFAKARREDRPIFLSIGYYTCHWCHVMERESFADAGIAELLNRHFVSIKVDREERPDIDRVYMSFVQATTGGGGWPLSAFLTPDLKPFFGGTYFPPAARYGHPGFANLLRTIAATWTGQRARIEDSAAAFCQSLREQVGASAAADASAGDDSTAGVVSPAGRVAVWQRLLHRLAAIYDAAQGGFGDAPKFPRPAALEFLFRFATWPGGPAAETQSARAMALGTLRAMARGGIRDPLAGGFHRYATDAAWRVPHFEKMLYDQAQLLSCYVIAWQLEGDAGFAAIARELADFVLAEMAAPGGGFFSAQDADSEIPPERRRPEGPLHGEGAYYVWTEAEIEAALADDAAAGGSEIAGERLRAMARRYFGVVAGGNVAAAQDPQGEFSGANILYIACDEMELAAEFGWPRERVIAALGEVRRRLLEHRRRRPRPATDDKILTAWNGLTISALARAGSALRQPRYLEAARDAAAWIEAHLYDVATQTLYRRFRDGERAIAGFADDYAFLVQGLLDLFEADSNPRWLAWARTLQRRQDELFGAEAGGYYGAGEDPHLWMRLREDYDGAEPSPNSVAAFNLLRLSAWFDDAAMRERAVATLAAFAPRLRSLPEALPLLAAALGPATQPPGLVAISGPVDFDLGEDDAASDGERQKARALLAVARGAYRPRHALIALAGERRQRALAELSSRLAELIDPRQAQSAGAFICEGYTCLPRITTPEELGRKLANN